MPEGGPLGWEERPVFPLCPCFRALLLSGLGHQPPLRELERELKAEEARRLGWAGQDASTREAMSALRGGGARARRLSQAIKRWDMAWDNRRAFRHDIAVGLSWVRHLRRYGIQDSRALHDHLRSSGVTAPGSVLVLERALGSSAVQEALGPTRPRASLKLGLAILAGIRGREVTSVTRAYFRREKHLMMVKVELNELERLRPDVAGAAPVRRGRRT